jgi:hypothetical protein
MPAKINFAKTKRIEKKILSGIAPTSIAEEENVSPSHVFSLKKGLVEKGHKIPEIKKGRPVAEKVSGEPDVSAQAVAGSSKSLRNTKKGVSINIEGFPRGVLVDLHITSKELIVKYGGTTKIITF